MIILLTSSNFDKKVHTKCHIQVSVTPPRSQVATCDMGHWTYDNLSRAEGEGGRAPQLIMNGSTKTLQKPPLL